TAARYELEFGAYRIDAVGDIVKTVRRELERIKPFDNDYSAVGMYIEYTLRHGGHLAFSNRRAERDYLVVEVGFVNGVGIHEKKPAHTRARERLCRMAAHSSDAEHGDRGSGKAFYGADAEKPGGPVIKAAGEIIC